jgi:hypothetical protein
MSVFRFARIPILGVIAAAALAASCGVEHRDGWFECEPGRSETCWSGGHCHSDGFCYSYPEEDAADDGGADDARRDADARPDVDADSGPDVVPDAEAEAGAEADAEPDADPDIEPDVEPETDAEPESDSGESEVPADDAGSPDAPVESGTGG